jgi:hypothetical protein
VITLPNAAPVDFKLTDVTGRTITTFSAYFLKGQNAVHSFNISYLPSGMYFLKAATNTNQQTVKVIKN